MSLAARHFEVVREISLPRAVVWHVLSHTDRFNRHIGLSPVDYGDLSSDTSGFFRAAKSRVGGVLLRWREYPFQWEHDGRYSVVRIYEQGPIERFEGGIALEDTGSGATKMTVFADMTGRGVVGQALLATLARQFLQKTLRFCDTHLSGADSNPQPRGPQPKQSQIDQDLLSRLLLDLKKRPVAEAYAEALDHYLRTAGDGEVAALRPYEWAKNSGLDEHEALRTCLHAVKSGILNLSWAMMCPNCRVSKLDTPTLGGLSDEVHCDLCGVGFDLNFDRYVELRFAVHPAIRRADSNVFCTSGPFSTPHILMQKCLEPGQTADFSTLKTAEPLRLRVLRLNALFEVPACTQKFNRLCFDGEKWNTASVAPATPSSEAEDLYYTGHNIIVTNGSEQTICIALEKQQWDALAATAARVTMLQEFRDLFPGEVLRPGRQVAVENVTIFFSDLSNSTSLYESIGDAPAFDKVGSHFDFLIKHITRYQGAVVKTMGDAVMAVFYHPENAVRAATEIQAQFNELRQTLDNSAMELKIGLHQGSALVVNSNDRLDYFGRSVNIAARVAGAAKGGELLLTGEVWENTAVQRYLIERRADLRRSETKLRGVEKPLALVRVLV